MVLLKRTSKFDAKSIRAYRLFVKQRSGLEIVLLLMDSCRLYKKNRDVLEGMELGDRIQALQHTYDNIEQDYQQILSRLFC